jgi:hypothetical protein
VDLDKVTQEDLHTRLVMFGEKHVGSTFQEAMADPTYMSYVMKWMVPRTFEEVAFKKYIDLVLDKHQPGEPEAISALTLARQHIFVDKQHNNTKTKHPDNLI